MAFSSLQLTAKPNSNTCDTPACDNTSAMPLYELLCLARPRIVRDDMARMIQRVGNAVFDKGGVITDLKSYGDQGLAYPIRKTHGKYEEVYLHRGSICGA